MLGNPTSLAPYLCKAAEEGRLTYKTDYPLSSLSTFRIGGNAAFVVFPKTADELASLITLCRSASVCYTVIGNGSNVLFDDRGYHGLILVTTALSDWQRCDNRVVADCGISLTYLASVVAKEGLGGLAFAYGIPGTLGGAVFMNAGAYGGEMRDIVSEVSWYDPETDDFGSFSGDENAFGYRESIYQRGDKLILSATLALTPADPAVLRTEMEDYKKRRVDKQPLDMPSAGSTFKRYPGYFTGKLIEEAGLKGYMVGGACVSEKHAGFIINRGNATASDVLTLIEYIKARIKERNGIEIACEVRYIPCPGKENG